MQAITALEGAGLTPGSDQPLLVTGASGGVGGSAVFALMLLFDVINGAEGVGESMDGRSETEGGMEEDDDHQTLLRGIEKGA